MKEASKKTNSIRNKGKKKKTNRKGRSSALPWLSLLPLLVLGILLVIAIWPRKQLDILYEHQPGRAPSQAPQEVPEQFRQIPGIQYSDVMKQIGTSFFLIKKQEGLTVSLEPYRLAKKQAVISVSGTDGATFSQNGLAAVADGAYSQNWDAMKQRVCAGIAQATVEGAPGIGSVGCRLVLQQTEVFDCELFEDDAYYYLQFFRPREHYKTLVVIDAGHGTPDGGASAADGTLEKDLTLGIALEIQKLSKSLPEIGFYFTRLTDERNDSDYSIDLHLRPELANALQADMLISLHFNTFQNATQNGTEVYYNEAKEGINQLTSEKLASILLKHVTEDIGTKKNGTVKAATLLTLVKEANMPVSLVEFAYLTNEGDLQRIREKGLAAFAQAIVDGVAEAAPLLEEPPATPTPTPTTAPGVTGAPAPGGKQVAFTFDDGPHQLYTQKIADELAKYNGHATWFVVGNRVYGEYAEGLRYASEKGNEIAIHGWTHELYYDTCTDREFEDELEKTRKIILETTGQQTTLMRPIGGRITSERVADCPYAVVMWSCDSQDWRYKGRKNEAEITSNINAIVQNVLSTVKPGDVILMHEIYQNSYEAFCILLKELHEQGYEFVTVTELFGTTTPGTKYRNRS